MSSWHVHSGFSKHFPRRSRRRWDCYLDFANCGGMRILSSSWPLDKQTPDGNLYSGGFIFSISFYHSNFLSIEDIFPVWLVYANGAIYDPMAKCKFHVLVMKMLRHMSVGWGWVGALITFLLMLRNSQLYAATTGDKVRNMWWRCYATCGLGGDGVGHWSRSCWCYATHSSTQQPQGTRYATCDEDATPHVGWVGMGWGTDNVPVDATQFSCWMAFARFSKKLLFPICELAGS